ncbi:hypothetical protein FRC08_004483 [Ceratobasidium sp. 394]|nr:hypothetical protein FRC08_004483 [Ceratobasidium sp. 394]
METLIESFAAFRKLRRLNGNVTLLYPSALQVLGGLPCLRQLAVSINDVPPLKYSTALPDDSFPSLQALSITGIKSASWIMSLWCVEPLVSRLEDIHLDICPQDLAQSGLNESWADDFLLQICDSSPQTSDIRVRFSYTDGDEEDEIPVSASQNALEALGQLPLISFWLGGIHFGGRAPCKILSSAWPDLNTLCCGNQRANLADLADFARNLPHLEILVLDLDMEVSGIPDYSAPSFAPVPRYTAFCCLSRDLPRPYKRTRKQTSKLAK